MASRCSAATSRTSTTFQPMRGRAGISRASRRRTITAVPVLLGDVDLLEGPVPALVDVGHSAGAVVAQVLGEYGVPASVTGTLWALAPGTADDARGGGPVPLRSLDRQPRRRQAPERGAHRPPAPPLRRPRTHPGPDDRGHELWEALRARLHASGLFTGLDAEEQRTLPALLTRMRPPR